jgi:hypothetical protein
VSEIISFARCVCHAKQEFTSKLPFCMLLPRFVHLQSCEGGKRAAVSPFDRQARGLASRRELTKSHLRQMVAIREAKRAALKAGKTWPPRDHKLIKLS